MTVSISSCRTFWGRTAFPPYIASQPPYRDEIGYVLHLLLSSDIYPFSTYRFNLCTDDLILHLLLDSNINLSVAGMNEVSCRLESGFESSIQSEEFTYDVKLHHHFYRCPRLSIKKMPIRRVDRPRKITNRLGSRCNCQAEFV